MGTSHGAELSYPQWVVDQVGLQGPSTTLARFRELAGNAPRPVTELGM